MKTGGRSSLPPIKNQSCSNALGGHGGDKRSFVSFQCRTTENSLGTAPGVPQLLNRFSTKLINPESFDNHHAILRRDV